MSIAQARSAYALAADALSHARRERTPEQRDLAAREAHARTSWIEALRTEHSPSLSLAQAQVVMDLAWEEGHSGGLESVEGYYQSFAEMVVEVVALG